jgi:hypothetical protein
MIERICCCHPATQQVYAGRVQVGEEGVLPIMKDGDERNAGWCVSKPVHFTLIAPATLKRKTLDPGFRRDDEQSIAQHPTSLPRLS